MSTQNRRERERQAKRSKILETAKALFESQGIMRVTMNDIAAACEYSIGSLYLYFKSKDDIYMGLAAVGAEKIDDLIRDCLTASESQDQRMPEAKVRQFVEGFLEIFASYGYYFDVLRLTAGSIDGAEFSQETFQALTFSTMNSVSITSKYFLNLMPQDKQNDDVALNSTFVAWSYLMGLAQLTSQGRDALIDANTKASLVNYIIDTLMGMKLVETMAKHTVNVPSLVKISHAQPTSHLS